jgi:hypothetical protein
MNVRQEILDNSAEHEVEALTWLLDHYSRESKWHFVARCIHVRYGKLSYQTNRVWTPTPEGWVLFNHRDEMIF